MSWRPLPSPPADREPRPVADSLERIATSIGAPRPGLLTTVFAGWEGLVGPDIAGHATPRSLRGGVLTVVVDHPAWATSLRLLSADLLRRIAADPDSGGAGEITELVVQVALPTRDRLPSAPEPRRLPRRGRGHPKPGPG
jgi:predicted nucleic acid-binding Zn ribbon protein